MIQSSGKDKKNHHRRMELIISTETFIFLFFIAITAGIVDTLAGVGGLIVLPALILSGLPPLTALGTNKAQSFAGTGTATYMMTVYKLSLIHI